ncbi:hypothetical protein V6N11_071848 [Hibiscus sabdariffa]|uniref:Uncharacterized protein n=1 Tax=Hibiscus sabdariffa TaxID=183260 RepID=A0ABR2U1R2_9ROSI
MEGNPSLLIEKQYVNLLIGEVSGFINPSNTTLRLFGNLAMPSSRVQMRFGSKSSDNSIVSLHFTPHQFLDWAALPYGVHWEMHEVPSSLTSFGYQVMVMKSTFGVMYGFLRLDH